MLWKDSRAVSEAGRMEKNEAPTGQEGQGGVAEMCFLQKGWMLLVWAHCGIRGAISTPAMELCQLAFVLSE